MPVMSEAYATSRHIQSDLSRCHQKALWVAAKILSHTQKTAPEWPSEEMFIITLIYSNYLIVFV